MHSYVWMSWVLLFAYTLVIGHSCHYLLSYGIEAINVNMRKSRILMCGLILHLQLFESLVSGNLDPTASAACVWVQYTWPKASACWRAWLDFEGFWWDQAQVPRETHHHASPRSWRVNLVNARLRRWQMFICDLESSIARVWPADYSGSVWKASVHAVLYSWGEHAQVARNGCLTRGKVAIRDCMSIWIHVLSASGRVAVNSDRRLRQSMLCNVHGA